MRVLFFLLLLPWSVSAQFPPVQTITTPYESPKALVMQRVGISDVVIEYSRPSIQGREIWGKLVPYNNGVPFPWRAGANENTTISFSHPVKVEGQQLEAGKYGLHMIPGKDNWIIIFSKNSGSWGSFYYRQSEDALRVVVNSSASPEKEFLQYEFDQISDSSAIVKLLWEKIQVPFHINFDTKKNMVDYIRASLRTPIAFSWQGLHSMAKYCSDNNYNLEEALSWSQRSIGAEENYITVRTKSDILEKLGRKASADSAWQRALRVGSFAELSRGLQMLTLEKNTVRIKDVSAELTSRFGDRWQTYIAIGNAYKNIGEKEVARKHFEKALQTATDDTGKKRAQDMLKGLN